MTCICSSPLSSYVLTCTYICLNQVFYEETDKEESPQGIVALFVFNA